MKLKIEEYKSWALNHEILYASMHIDNDMLRMWVIIGETFRVNHGVIELYNGGSLNLALDAWNSRVY